MEQNLTGAPTSNITDWQPEAVTWWNWSLGRQFKGIHKSTENWWSQIFNSYFQAASIYRKSQAEKQLEKFGLNPLPWEVVAGATLLVYDFSHVMIMIMHSPKAELPGTSCITWLMLSTVNDVMFCSVVRPLSVSADALSSVICIAWRHATWEVARCVQNTAKTAQKL